MTKVYHVKFESTEEKTGDEQAIAAAKSLRSIPGVTDANASRSFDIGPAIVVVQAADDVDEKLLPEGAELVAADAKESTGDDATQASTGNGAKAKKSSGTDVTA